MTCCVAGGTLNSTQLTHCVEKLTSAYIVHFTLYEHYKHII